MPLKNWCSIYARCSKSSLKHSIRLEQNLIAYRSSKVSDCIFEIHHLWQSGFIGVYSNCCCSCWFEPEIIEIGQSFHKTYSNNILNCQQSTTISNAHTKKVWKLILCPPYIYIYIYTHTNSVGFFVGHNPNSLSSYIYIYIYVCIYIYIITNHGFYSLKWRDWNEGFPFLKKIKIF